MAFNKQIKLHSILNENWIEKEHEEHLQILKSHPLDGLAGLKATYFRELREKGNRNRASQCNEFKNPHNTEISTDRKKLQYLLISIVKR